MVIGRTFMSNRIFSATINNSITRQPDFFTSMGTAKQTFYYAVRAVSPGQYKMGPVSADAMYNGEYHSYSGAGVVRVVR